MADQQKDPSRNVRTLTDAAEPTTEAIAGEHEAERIRQEANAPLPNITAAERARRPAKYVTDRLAELAHPRLLDRILCRLLLDAESGSPKAQRELLDRLAGRPSDSILRDKLDALTEIVAEQQQRSPKRTARKVADVADRAGVETDPTRN